MGSFGSCAWVGVAVGNACGVAVGVRVGIAVDSGVVVGVAVGCGGLMHPLARIIAASVRISRSLDFMQISKAWLLKKLLLHSVG